MKSHRQGRAVIGVLLMVVVGCTSGAVDSTSTSTPEVQGSTTTTSHDHQTTTSISGGTAGLTQVVISADQDYPEGFTVPAGESWVLDPNKSITLTSSGNVLVLGELVMKPASGDIEHALIFQGVDNSAFVGGGMDPVPTDVGLWVMGDGRLDLEGEEKPAWGYEYDPSWQGDEVMAAPNTPGDYFVFEEVTSTPPPNELGYPTELINLTRNVRIEGTPEGFSHVFLRSTQPQTIRYVALRYMAPHFGDSDRTGRYGLHFHMAGEGSRGSIVEGVVVRDAGNHAFVPHASHGITFRDTIAYNVLNEAYWWDPPPEEDDTSNDTNDLIWDRAVVAGVDLGVEGNKFRLAGFFLGNGANVTISNSVAVAVRGEPDSESSGFIWPEGAGRCLEVREQRRSQQSVEWGVRLAEQLGDPPRRRVRRVLQREGRHRARGLRELVSVRGPDPPRERGSHHLARPRKRERPGGG